MTCPQFPKNFYFAAAFQIESGWNEDGEGLLTWDMLMRIPFCGGMAK